MARIKIDTERIIGTIDRNIFGGVIEQVGRAVYGGIYDPGSKQANADGFRKDVITAAKRMCLSVIRWPGGHWADVYRWQDGIGPQKNRPARPVIPWPNYPPEPNGIGTDEFIRFCRKVNAEPQIMVNCCTGGIQDAMDWVEYCNGVQDTYWAQQRAALSGRSDPHKVKYWGLGCEIDYPWQIGHKSADEYAKVAFEFAKGMKRVDPAIKTMACGSSLWESDWGVPWDRAVVKYMCQYPHLDYLDYLGIHTYVVVHAGDTFKQRMGASETLNRRLDITQSAITAALAEIKSDRQIHISVDEWGVLYPVGNGEYRETYNLEDALVIAMFLNSFINHCNTVTMANLNQLVNLIAPMMVVDDKLLLQSIFFPVEAYAAHNTGQALDLFYEGEDYETENSMLGKFRTGYLDVSASRNEKQLVLNVVNKSANETLTIEGMIEGREYTEISGILITGDAPEVENTPDKPDRIRTETIKGKAVFGNRFKLAVPPLSVNVYRLRQVNERR